MAVWLAAAFPAPARDWDFQDHTLDNGLRVISLEDHSAPVCTVQVWYHVGSKNEDPQRQGFAHMFEHMMFKGTDRVGPEEHSTLLRAFGGKVNAGTSFDETVYLQEIPPNQLDLALWLEAERMANLTINEEYFASEREVVKEEYRKGVLEQPYGRVPENALALIFKKHPYRWSTIGNLDHLNAATAEELKRFFDTYYVPNNATLVVVGDVRHEDVLAKAKQYFGAIPRAADPPRITIVEPPPTEPRRLEMYDKVPLTLVAVGYHTVPVAHEDADVLEVLAKIMSAGQSGRVYRTLVKEQGLAVFAMAGSITFEQAGIFGLGAVLKPGADAEALESAANGLLDALVKTPVTSQELEKARNQVAAEAVRARFTTMGRARRLGHAAVIAGDVNRVNTELQRVMRVTADDIQRVAAKYFRSDRRITLIVQPELAKVGKTLGKLKGLFGGKKKDKKQRVEDRKLPKEDKH
jgi:predicted Zn-dependent peptidase